MKPGDLVVNNPGGSSKLFSEYLDSNRSGQRKYLGIFTGIGLVLQVHGSDALITSNGITGWCYLGNIEVVA